MTNPRPSIELHVLSFYGIPDADTSQEAMARNEALLRALFAEVAPSGMSL